MDSAATAAQPLVTSSSHLASSTTSGLRSLVVALGPGAVQGATTVLLGHPLDTAKTRMQASGPNAQLSLLATMARMMRCEGPRSLFRGCTPPLLMEGMKRGLQFALWDIFRDARDRDCVGAGDDAPAAGRAVLSAIGANPFLSGAVAGGLGTTIGCPMHVIKIQTQYQTKESTRNAWTCTMRILRRDGPLGFYRGFKYNLLKDVFFAGAYLGMYGWLRERWAAPGDAKITSASAKSVRAFLAGATASVVTWTALYPLDTLKTLAQAGQQHRLTTQLLRRPRHLYRGLAASLLKAGPVSGISMCVYELAKAEMGAW